MDLCLRYWGKPKMYGGHLASRQKVPNTACKGSCGPQILRILKGGPQIPQGYHAL